ncbi:hypothetical protein BHE74_00033522 [Ensete ventricosum]|nr:hypothetical protein BHE74_00033522 [Ensete ventricosum]
MFSEQNHVFMSVIFICSVPSYDNYRLHSLAIRSPCLFRAGPHSIRPGPFHPIRPGPSIKLGSVVKELLPRQCRSASPRGSDSGVLRTNLGGFACFVSSLPLGFVGFCCRKMVVLVTTADVEASSRRPAVDHSVGCCGFFVGVDLS